MVESYTTAFEELLAGLESGRYSPEAVRDRVELGRGLQRRAAAKLHGSRRSLGFPLSEAERDLEAYLRECVILQAQADALAAF